MEFFCWNFTMESLIECHSINIFVYDWDYLDNVWVKNLVGPLNNMKLAVTGAAVYSVPIIGRRESIEHRFQGQTKVPAKYTTHYLSGLESLFNFPPSPICPETEVHCLNSHSQKNSHLSCRTCCGQRLQLPCVMSCHLPGHSHLVLNNAVL